MSPSLQPPLDTENAAWKMDKTKFGYRMLQKMGWEEGKGLGANEDGVVEHVRVRRKLTLAGVGAAGTNAAWQVPAKVAAGLNDVLAALKAVETRPIREGGREKVEKRRGFYERRRAGKCVANYSKKDLREIFGGAECGVGESGAAMKAEKTSSGNSDARQEHGEALKHDLGDRKRDGRFQDERGKEDGGREDRRRQRKMERKERKELRAKKMKKLKVKSDINKMEKAKKTKKEKSKW